MVGVGRAEDRAMQFDIQRVRANIRQASTEDLLDRVTVYRAEMEPTAVAMSWSIISPAAGDFRGGASKPRRTTAG